MNGAVAIFLVLSLAPSPPPAPEEAAWTWAGLEILGNHRVDRREIASMIPVPMGGAWHRGDAPFWSESCAEVRRKFDFASVDCGDRPLRVFDGRKAYLIVDIVEKGRERLLAFLPAPAGGVPFENDEMVALAAELESRTMAAAVAGHPYRESGDKGYLSYDDPTGAGEDVTPMVVRLSQLVPPIRTHLIEVLRHEKDPKNRRTAATLLNWSGGDIEETLGLTLPLLLDPDEGVRNNLSRFMIQFVSKVESKRLRRKLMTAFIDQIERPSHGDRNKGLYNLLGIAKARPTDRGFLWKHGERPIRYLADNSIVFNVQGPARELIALLAPAGRT